MHYYQFNIGDYASHTSRLTPIEDLAYRRLLDLYYLNEQPLNGCVTDVAREIGLTDYMTSVEYVLEKFFTLDENVFNQKRIDIEIKKYKSNAKNKSKAGKASAKARQHKASSKGTGVEQVLDSVDPLLNGCSTDEQLNINHKPLTNNHKTINNKQVKEVDSEVDSAFDLFWSAGMKKVGKPKAFTAFKKQFAANKNNFDGVEQFAEKLHADVKSRFSNNQFGFDKTHPTSYLNGEGWNDEQAAQTTANSTSTKWAHLNQPDATTHLEREINPIENALITNQQDDFIL